MKELLTDIINELNDIIENINTQVSSVDGFNYSQRNWNVAGISKLELINEAQQIIKFIQFAEILPNRVEESKLILDRYLQSLKFLRQYTIPNLWGNSAQAVPAYIITIQSLKTAIMPLLIGDDSAELAKQLKNQRRRVRSLEASINDLEPRVAPLKEIVSRIEQAHETAEQLPTDLESLSEARKSVSVFAKEAAQDQNTISNIKLDIEQIKDEMKQKSTEADNILENCEKAYAAATSVGLAAAFTERSDKLSKSMWVWVAGLILSLFAGGYFGSSQLQKLLELLAQKDISTTSMSINFIMAILSIGAPIWFSWLATKQIGQRFKLAEDYAFKASVSRAYEGFRKEASRFDKDMESKLLNSALTRLDELPLRLVENESHGSPWHELASSNIFKEAMAKVPGFTEKVKKLAQDNIQANFDSSPNTPTKKQVQNEENE